MKTLTWYPGTIRPYESLWHILLRATWLNDLRAGDIRTLYSQRKSPYLPDACTVKNSRLIARALGEPARTFAKYATWDQFPSGIRSAVMSERLRWCPQCIEAGYHTLLGSIQLVSRCPIHSSLLICSCPVCKEGFNDNINGLVVRRQFCRCGRTRLMAKDIVWDPSVSTTEANTWAPVAKWVNQVGEVATSDSLGRLPLTDTRLALILRWCNDSGIECPDCFDDESSFWHDPAEKTCWSIYKACSGNLNDVKTPELPSPYFLPAASGPSDQSTVYRAIARYIRRHGCANPDGEIKTLMSTLDPAVFAINLAGNPRARVAFTEMLWARQMEPWAVYRRWPNRPTEPGFAPSTVRNFKYQIDLHHKVGQTRFSGSSSLSKQGYRWVLQHATAIEARQVWGRATRQTTKSIEDGWADWTTDHKYFESNADVDAAIWFYRPNGTRVDFVGYVRNAYGVPFLNSDLTEKQQDEPLAEKSPSRKASVERLSKQPCLTWSQRDGWQVENGAIPDDDVRRVALLHTGLPTVCWIFKSQGVFFARVFNGIIQASGTTAKEALCGLRMAVMHYRKTYEPNHAAKTPHESIVKPVPESLVWSAFCVRMQISRMRGSYAERFWNAAWISRSLGESADGTPTG